MNKHLSYASFFVSYLLNEIQDKSLIKDIILFGSAARGEARKDSDVDIFIDVKKDNKKNEAIVLRIVESFYDSKEYLSFKNKGIDNKLNVIIGKLENFKDLKESIENQGIVLYGPFKSSNVSGRKMIVVFWDKIGLNRGAFLNQVYGFNSKGKRYLGVIDKHGGKKLGKSSIMLPIENKNAIFDLIKKYKVSAKFIEVYDGS
ncbi:MAG: nucleotidyltransferase domain-containing protein [Nanoarchaeota archaeon]